MRRFFLVILGLLLFVLATPVPISFAAPSASIDFWPSQIPADSTTPFAVFVSLNGGSINTDYYVTVYVFSLAAYGNSNPQAQNWRADLAGWRVAGGANDARITITTNADGDWSGWVYVRVNTPSAEYTDASLRVRFRPVAVTGNVDGTKTVPLLDMTGGEVNLGGWIEEVEGTARAGRVVAIRNATDLIGLYVAEDNAIEEGYPSTPGYYKVAVPACDPCNYSIETWELGAPGTAVGQVNTMPDINGNNIVTAGQTTTLTFGTPTAVQLTTLQTTTATIPAVAFAAVLMLLTGTAVALRRRPL
jgi:hypothetical protein